MLILAPVLSQARMDMVRESQLQILESGGPISNESRCRTRLYNDIMDCKENPGSSAAAYCDTLARRDDGLCPVNRCLQEKRYPLGLNTNPADYCIGSIPKSVQPTVSEISASNQRFKAAQDGSKFPAEVPLPTWRPTADDSKKPAVVRPTNTSPSNWAQEANQDIQQCISAQTQANTCCTQPQKCAGQLTDSQKNSMVQLAQAAKNRNDTASLKQICAQSEAISASGSNVNTGFANVCYAKHNQCSVSCGEMLSKWQQRLSSCGANCDRQVVSTAVNELQTKNNQCKGYASLESRIRSQSFATAESTELSALCVGQLEGSGAQDQGYVAQQNQSGGFAGGTSPNFAAGVGGALASLNSNQKNSEDREQLSLCEQNPHAPGCYIDSPQAQSIGGSSSESSNVAASTPAMGMAITPNGFNVGENNNLSDANTTLASVTPQSSNSAVIPNGSGGGASGGSETGTQPSPTEELPSMLGNGKNPNTDILKGESGGGGYAQPVASGSQGSGFENRYPSFRGLMPGSQGRVEGGKKYVGMDLKKYLPGQMQDPKRGLAGFGSNHPDIGPMHVDFFQRVSGRLQTLCKLHRLLDCQ